MWPAVVQADSLAIGVSASIALVWMNEPCVGFSWKVRGAIVVGQLVETSPENRMWISRLDRISF